MATVEIATEVERAKYYCSGRKCQLDPEYRVSYDILVRGEKRRVTKYLCKRHSRKYLEVPLKKVVERVSWWTSLQKVFRGTFWKGVRDGIFFYI